MDSKKMTLEEGSPPRMREKHVLCANYVAHQRITPAYAGKTLLFRQNAQICWDHPRVCGKNAKNPVTAESVRGSPPRMREKHAEI